MQEEKEGREDEREWGGGGVDGRKKTEKWKKEEDREIRRWKSGRREGRKRKREKGRRM